MNICVVSPSYPTSKTIVFVFVDQLCRALTDLGEHLTVIAPQSVTRCMFRGEPLVKSHYRVVTKAGNSFEVYRPYAFTMGNGKFRKVTKWSFRAAVNRAYKRLKVKPDVLYGHFWSSISAALPLAMNDGIPLFGASGEENVAFYDNYTQEHKCLLSAYVSGLVNVSTKNRNECIGLKLIDESKTTVIPNAVDLSLFNGLDKLQCREELRIGEDEFVVAFLGQFVPRKGTMRLNEALKSINDPKVKAMFIGSGVEDPNYEGIIFKGRLDHDSIPKYLTACDVFVLPTENEGCSNAVIEALACGLPIISTDAEFNYDILDKSNAILIDCHNISQIADAINLLKNNPNRQKELSEGARKKATGLAIDKRAEKILTFIKSRLWKN